MQTYTVVYRGESAGFDVQIKDDSGARHSLTGFKTEAEARAWIEEDKKAAATKREGAA